MIVNCDYVCRKKRRQRRKKWGLDSSGRREGKRAEERTRDGFEQRVTGEGRGARTEAWQEATHVSLRNGGEGGGGGAGRSPGQRKMELEVGI